MPCNVWPLFIEPLPVVADRLLKPKLHFSQKSPVFDGLVFKTPGSIHAIVSTVVRDVPTLFVYIVIFVYDVIG